MKLSHLIYRGRTLDEAVQQFRDLGFHVEYGSKHNPQNALIYFSTWALHRALGACPTLSSC